MSNQLSLNNFLSQLRFLSESNRILNESLHELPKYKTVIDDDIQLNEINYCDSHQANNICPIFYTSFSDDDKVIELPCKHCFTPSAIRKWLKEEKNVCPVCRFELKSKEIERSPPITVQPTSTSNPVRPVRPSLNQLFDYLLHREEETDLQIAMYASLYTRPYQHHDDEYESEHRYENRSDHELEQEQMQDDYDCEQDLEENFNNHHEDEDEDEYKDEDEDEYKDEDY